MKTLVTTSCAIGLALSMTACNGGSVTSTGSPGAVPGGSVISETIEVPTDAQTKTPASAYTTSSTVGTASASDSAGNSCFNLIATANGKNYVSVNSSAQYYSTVKASFTLQNSCATAQKMTGLQVNVTGQTLNGSPATINYIEQGQGNPYLTMSYAVSGSNAVISLSTPACSGTYCDWTAFPAKATRVFTINSFVNAPISSFNITGISISGSTPPPPVVNGALAVNVNTSALSPLCKSSSSCKIGVNVLDPSGTIIQKISVKPYESPNYTVTYQNLLIGNYTLAVDTSTFPVGSAGSIAYTYAPANGIVPVNSGITSNSSINFSYTAPKQNGSIVIKTATIAESSAFSSIGSLSGVATDNITNISYPFTLGLNSSYILSNLPAGDTVSVKLQGLADAATGVYYTVPVVQTTVVANSSTNVNLSFAKVTSVQNSVVFSVSGAPVNQTVTFAGNNAVFKYKTVPLLSSTYKFLTSESAIAVTLTTPTSYTLVYAPQVITPSVRTFTATYTPQVTPVNGSLTTSNDQIVDSNGNVIKLKGINWFGFNNSDMLNGMWNYDGLSGDFQTTVLRLKALGFNAVRLPFTFPILNSTTAPQSYARNISPATNVQLITNLTNPSYSISGKSFPSLSYNPSQSGSNSNIPNATTMARFIWVIDFFAKNGFYVLIDNHTEDNTLTQNSASWIQNWKNLATNISNGMPASSSAKVMYDIRNEPDAIGYKWAQMGPIYLSAMDAINTVTNNKNLFFIEGMGQGGINANWGDGFATNTTVISQSGLSNPNDFFKGLATRAYLNQVVLSPHVYPPTVTNASADYSGAGLYKRLSTSFGTLAKTGYCVSVNSCHKFPIAIGEFGSFFSDSRDLQFFQSFASYLNNNNDANDGLHNTIDGWFYWSYNPNSGDTGGIVANDWTTVQWPKINYLSNGTISGISSSPNGLGLVPWYR